MGQRTVDVYVLAFEGDGIELEGDLIAKEIVVVDSGDGGATAEELLNYPSFEGAILLGFQILVGQGENAKSTVDTEGFFEARLLDSFAIGKAQACCCETI